MRKLLITLFLTGLTSLTSPTGLFAQGLGYVEGGLAGGSGFFGQWSASFHAAGGGEVVAADRIGIGGELGFFDRLVVGSANLTVHLAGVRHATLSPFITGGYSRMGIGDGEGAFSAWNAGAGLHYWASDRFGLRLEFRDHIRPDDRGNTHYWSLRTGVVLR